MDKYLVMIWTEILVFYSELNVSDIMKSVETR
jgi:hypothetical protein